MFPFIEEESKVQRSYNYISENHMAFKQQNQCLKENYHLAVLTYKMPLYKLATIVPLHGYSSTYKMSTYKMPLYKLETIVPLRGYSSFSGCTAWQAKYRLDCNLYSHLSVTHHKETHLHSYKQKPQYNGQTNELTMIHQII